MKTLARFLLIAIAMSTHVFAQFTATPVVPGTARTSTNNGTTQRSDTVQTMHTKLPEISVVATRDAQDPLRVPLAISIVPAEEFRNNRGYGLDEALAHVPGALVQSRSGNQDVRVVIRGFGARGAGERSNAGTTRGLRFLLDGMPITEPDGRTSLDLIDLGMASNVEVLRSNTSALWGNASGGVVSISTLPRYEGSYASAQATMSSFGYAKHTVQCGTTEGSSKIYAGMSNTMFDGWRDHSGSATFQALAGVDSYLNSATRLHLTVLAASNSFHIPGPLTLAQFEENAKQAQADTLVYNPTYVQRDERRFNRVGRISFSIDQQLAPEHSLRYGAYVEPKYLQRSERNTFRDFNRYHVGGSLAYHYTTSFGSSINNHFQAGVDEQYQDGAILFYNLDLNTKGRGTTLRDNKREGAQNLGFFFQDQLSIGDKLIVLLGGRLDDISYYSQSFINPKINDERSFSQFSPKLGLSYLVAEDMCVYANYSQGVEVPAGNETDPPSALGEDTLRSINSLLKPIQSQTIELGLKHHMHLGSGMLQGVEYDLALYSVTTTNDLVPYRGGRFYMPAGETSRKGVEIGAGLEFAGGLHIHFSLSASSNTLEKYLFDSIYVNASLAGHTLDLSGKEMPGVPSLFGGAVLRWEPNFLRHFRADLEWHTISAYAVNDVNSVETEAHSMFNFMACYELKLTNSWSVDAFARVDNLSDSKYIASVWLNPDNAVGGTKAPAYIEPGLPRTISAGLRLRYTW